MNDSSNIWDALIVGGGIAGCSAAIHLARRGYKTLVLEQKRYPANKLCGEFLSIEAAGYLERLGVLDDVLAAGAKPVTLLRIFGQDGSALTGNLPGVALGITRASLDQILVRRARNLGAECLEGMHVRDIRGSLRDGFTVGSNEQDFDSRTVFGAYGKRSPLDESQFRRVEPQSPFVAFKCHYSGAFALDAVEIYAFPGGYVGFGPVEEGQVNACFITHRRSVERVGGKAEAFIEMAAQSNPALSARLSRITRADHMIGCSQISFRVKSAFARGVCMVGDTAGMIAPLCGDGMSMAMRSAEIAADRADAYLSGRTTAAGFERSYTSRWQREFLLRLLVGRALQEASQYPAVASAMIRLCNAMPSITNGLIRVTRGRPALAPLNV